VIRQALVLAAIGVVLGHAIALGSSRYIGSMLFGIAATDLLTLGSMSLLLIGLVVLASYLPAFRATRIDAMAALRQG